MSATSLNRVISSGRLKNFAKRVLARYPVGQRQVPSQPHRVQLRPVGNRGGAIGVRDHMHVAVNAIYNKFPVGGKVRKTLDVLTDVVVLLCGLFMLYSGGARTIKLFGLPGVLPITGISTAWQYLPIPIAGFVITFDSILFLTGIVSRDDLLYSEKEIDYTDVAALKEMEKKEDEHK